MKVQKEHKKATLMRWSKEELVEYILCLEHNINAVNESFENQYNNCLRMLDDMKAVNETYTEAKLTIKNVLHKGDKQ